MNTEQVRYVDDAITSRHSVRVFLDTHIETETIKGILAVDRRAPPGLNTRAGKTSGND